MNRIVVYLQSMAPEVVTRAFPDHELLLVHSKSECAHTLASGAPIDGLLVQRDAFGPEYRSFLASIKLHFPLLEIVLIAPVGPTSTLEGCYFVDGSVEPPALADRLAAFSRAFRTDQRRAIRFGWPLRGQLSAEGSEAACRIRDFSSSGAFLETDAALRIGSVLTLRIEFLNSKATVMCTCVRRQEALAEAQAQAEAQSQAQARAEEPGGYGVRFRDLSPQAGEIFQRIVDDAVIRALLYPEQEAQIPTLDDDDLQIPGFDAM